jgi:ribosome-associated heat shock protein Hsp15
VAVNEHPAKPARDVRPGETVTVKQGLVLRTLRVIGVPASRVGAKLVPNFCADLTPKEELEKARENSVQHLLAREKGSGRPTKRDRRLLDQVFL